jgi:membrane fusion protein (multidrug efflux system)
MFIRAIIEEGVDERAFLIPQQAISRDFKGNPNALVVDAEEKVQLRPLQTNRAIGNTWLVSSGLTEGDRVIVEGLQKVRPGAAVKAVPFQTDEVKAVKLENTTQPAQKRIGGGV